MPVRLRKSVCMPPARLRPTRTTLEKYGTRYLQELRLQVSRRLTYSPFGRATYAAPSTATQVSTCDSSLLQYQTRQPTPGSRMSITFTAVAASPTQADSKDRYYGISP